MNKQPKIQVVVKRKVTFEEAISQKRDKYFNLVWYARRNWSQVVQWPIDTRMTVTKHMIEIERKYPKETSALKSRKEGDWQHGFNSGMLAGMRYVMTCLDKSVDEDEGLPMGGVENAESEFPFLDT